MWELIIELDSDQELLTDMTNEKFYISCSEFSWLASVGASKTVFLSNEEGEKTIRKCQCKIKG